jgi:hypothetical protein
MPVSRHDVRTAVDGVLTLEQLENVPAEFVLLDIGLPAVSTATTWPSPSARD